MQNMNDHSLSHQVELPAIAAPMFLVSSPQMVIESCKNGVIGTFPLLNARTGEILEEWMRKIKNEVESDSVTKMAPWGVNLIVHRTNNRYESDLELVKKYQPPIVITSLGNPTAVVDIVHEYGGHVFSDVITIKHAKKAAQAGVDGLILVCNGAGGHGGKINPLAFLAEVKEFWDGFTVLAGAISNGRDILAAKVLGADFSYIGTRFIATNEAIAQDEYKEMLVESKSDDIIYTDAISGVNANFLRPSIEKAGLDADNLQKKETVDVVHNQDDAKSWKDIWSAGQGVGAIKDVQPIAEVINELKAEYKEAVTKVTEK
ncbi:nitronate monooxygenase [Geomicrobium halophilum]|uniref:Probable nitronate monooxygenase n=1 Tax=Geomicrobium halophilum TaxID=549000 RepID=A0A841PNN6_9BACL|nr:nitronate monooxygenase [Geomicrobium halophilum]MBB6450447.1 nitronate monooxygenase [Geomicrobium halophilum]